jgi:hypothetical protein
MQTRRFVSVVSIALLLVPTMAPGKVSAQISTGVSAVADIQVSEIPSQNAEDFLSEQSAPSQGEVEPIKVTPRLDDDLVPEIVPSDEKVPIEDQLKSVEKLSPEIRDPDDPSLLLEEGDSGSPISTPNPQRLSSLPQSSGQFTADLFTGSASYVYQFIVPDGRAGLTPSLALRTNYLVHLQHRHLSCTSLAAVLSWYHCN